MRTFSRSTPTPAASTPCRWRFSGRRGHYFRITCSHPLPHIVIDAKLDFSRRGLILPASVISLLYTPIHDLGFFDPSFTVPVIAPEENCAEKLARWLIEPLVRDLADLVRLLPHMDRLDWIAALCAVKSYFERFTEPFIRRSKPLRATLSQTLDGLTAADFNLQALVLPNATPNADLSPMITRWIAQLREPFNEIDEHLAAGNLQRFTTATDDSLLNDAFDRSEEIRAAYRIFATIPGRQVQGRFRP